MEYLLKVSTVVAIFYLSYKIFLQRETFFEKNRWFLLIGLLTAFLLPFLVIPIYVEATPLDFSNYIFETNPVTKNAEKPFNILDYLPLIYGLGVLFFSARFSIQFISLARVIFKNQGEKIGNFIFIKTTNNVSPFSFFNWIVYNPTQFSSAELDQIITHEKVHANQVHSFDILLTHFSCIVLWFNPFMWLYNKDLKQNLEFIADKITASKSDCRKSYQYTLLKTSMPSHQMALSNPFYNSLIKKRIVMLHKSKSKKINQIKYALIIPILALFLMSFNTEEVYVTQQKPSTETLTENNVVEVIISKDFTDADLENLQTELKQEGYTVKFKGIKRNSKNEIIAIKVEVTSKSSNANYSIDGDEPISPIKIGINNNDITIGKGNVLKEKHIVFISGDEEEDEVIPSISKKKVIIISSDNDDHTTTEEEIITKKADSIQFSKRRVGLNWVSDEDKKASIHGKSESKVKIITSGDKEPLFIIDGKEITKDDMNSLDPNTIEKVEVIKDDNATRLYGNKGKHGVVLITSKNEDSSKYTVKLSTEALYKIDGKEVKKVEVDKLNPEDIESVNVYKGNTAIEKYGEKAKNGVIEITTKKKK